MSDWKFCNVSLEQNPFDDVHCVHIGFYKEGEPVVCDDGTPFYINMFDYTENVYRSFDDIEWDTIKDWNEKDSLENAKQFAEDRLEENVYPVGGVKNISATVWWQMKQLLTAFYYDTVHNAAIGAKENWKLNHPDEEIEEENEEKMTAQDYIDEFMDYIVERYKERNETIEPDAEDIRIFSEDAGLEIDFINEKTSRDNVDAFACYDLIRELEFTEWKEYQHPTTIWDVAYIALFNALRTRDSEEFYQRCADKINEAQED